MRFHLIFITIAGLLILGGICSAAYIPDDTSTVTTSKEWVIVAQQSTITVLANNATGGPVTNASVNLVLNSTTWGTLSKMSATTDATGTITSTFTAGTTPGAVNITATITFEDNGTPYIIQKTYTQKIDHDAAYSAAYTYSVQATVATETPFNISYTDKYGNQIDNRNTADLHSVTLSIGSTNNEAKFNISGTYLQSTTIQLDANGKLFVNVLMDTAPSANNIYISPIGYIGNGLKTIYGIPNGVPFSINAVVSPDNPASLPADNEADHKFTLTWTLLDRYGNVAQNQSILIQITGKSDIYLTSNQWGSAVYNIGPTGLAQVITVKATPVANTTISNTTQLEFYNTAPVSMVFSATPQVMPSRDSSPNQTSTLVAKVTDENGNPVANETITFTMGTPSYDYTPAVTAGPQLPITSAVTDDYGNAIVTFIPGSFNTSKANVTTFDATDTGTVTVTATWSTISQPLALTWKNYPYLKPNITINPTSVNVGDTFDVTISLTGDGWNLTGHPADVAIVTDLAGGIGGPQLLAQTQPAEKAFVGHATNDTYISLVTFGNAPRTSGTPYASTDTINLWNQQVANKSLKLFNPYGNVWDYNYVDPADWNYVLKGYYYCFTPSSGSGQDCTRAPTGKGVYWQNPYSDAKIVQDLMNAGPGYTANRNTLNSSINAYVSAGGTNYAAGINGAIKELNAKGNPTHNQTIIIMGDGINMMAPVANGGTPISNQSLESYWPSDWTPNPSLGYFDESMIGQAAAVDAANRAKAQNMTIYAIGFSTTDKDSKSQNNFTFFKPLASSSNCFYDESNDPSYNNLTSIFLDILGKVQTTAGVNTTMDLDFSNVNVIYNNTTQTEAGKSVLQYVYLNGVSTKIVDQNGVVSYVNQTDDWNNNSSLIFNIGTISVGQTWSTTFRMKVLTGGNIEVISNKSLIKFNTGESEQFGSNFASGGYNNTNTGGSTPTIQVTDLHSTQNTTITDFVPLIWNITYTGNRTIEEDIYHSTDNINWNQDYSTIVNGVNQTSGYNLDIRSWPAGTYYIKVVANAQDVQQPDSQTISAIVGNAQKAYIKLE
jgi:hypothetical protein